eukprot:scaffold12794_cov100-Skeletonema_dohrnii-CCMP3373.AAC.1
MPYVWCGQLRRTVDLSNDDDDKSHCARIAFFQCGVYVVSACAKVSSHGTPGVEEFWQCWSEMREQIDKGVVVLFASFIAM